MTGNEPQTSLLVKLRRYTTTPGRDPREDFVTEAFGWLLARSPGFERAFLDWLWGQIKDKPPFPKERPRWETQHRLGQKRPDMVAIWDDLVLIFEHKVNGPLMEDQLFDYRTLSEESFPNKTCLLVGITATPADFLDKSECRPEVQATWKCVYTVAQKVLTSQLSRAEQEYIQQFTDLLDYEALGPASPVDLQAVRYYPIAGAFPEQLEKLLKPLESPPPIMEGYSSVLRKKCGRVALEMERVDDGGEWSPGFLFGCVLDGSDLGISHRTGREIKLHAIVSFSPYLHGKYRNFKSYDLLKQELEEKAAGSNWEVYESLSDPDAANNYHHPLFVEEPLLDILAGSKTFEEQQKAIAQKANEVFELITSTEAFPLLKEECSSGKWDGVGSA